MPRSSYRKKPREIDTGNDQVAAMDKVIAADPPVIQWVPNGRGVLVAAYVHDPHPDGGHRIPKERCINGHQMTMENTVYRSDGTRGCLICKRKCDRERQARKRALETPLLAAARSEL